MRFAICGDSFGFSEANTVVLQLYQLRRAELIGQFQVYYVVLAGRDRLQFHLRRCHDTT
jgi:hypothetical protein